MKEHRVLGVVDKRYPQLTLSQCVATRRTSQRAGTEHAGPGRALKHAWPRAKPLATYSLFLQLLRGGTVLAERCGSTVALSALLLAMILVMLLGFLLVIAESSAQISIALQVA